MHFSRTARDSGRKQTLSQFVGGIGTDRHSINICEKIYFLVQDGCGEVESVLVVGEVGERRDVGARGWWEFDNIVRKSETIKKEYRLTIGR